MSKYCSDCRYFEPEKKKDGKDGCCMCIINKKYMFANKECCENFESSGRSNRKKEDLYDSAKKINNTSSTDNDILILVLVIIIFIVVKLI